MTTPNTPENSIDKKNQPDTQSIEKENILQFLLKNGVHDVYRMPGDPLRISPTQYKKSVDVLQASIIRYAQKMASGDPKAYGIISQKEIVDFVTKQKIELLREEFFQPLRSQRTLLMQRTRAIFPKIKNTYGNWDDILDSNIQDMDENQLSKLSENRQSLSAYIQGIFPNIDPVFDIEKFREAFGDIASTYPDLYKRIEKAARAYEKSSKNLPSPKLLAEVFDAYRGNLKQQLYMAEYFGVNFSLKDLVEANIYNFGDVEQIAKIQYHHIWDTVDDDVKKELVNILLYDVSFQMSVAEIEQGKFTDTNWKKIEKQFQKNYTSQAEYLLGKGKDIGESPVFGDLYPVTHDGVMKKIIELRTYRKKPQLEGIKDIKQNTVIAWKDRDQKTTHVLQINQINVPDADNIFSGVELSVLTGMNGTLSASGQSEYLDYEQFADFLADIGQGRILSEEEFNTLKTTNTDEATEGVSILDATEGEKVYSNEMLETKNTKEWFLNQIKEIDPNGEQHGMDTGTTFISRAAEPDKKGVRHEMAYRVELIKDGHITITHNGKHPETTDFAHFIEVARNNEQGFRRIARMNTDADFLQALGGFGIDTAHTELKDGQLITEVHETPSDDHHGDHHGHDHHDDAHATKKVPIEFFQSKDDGSHIRIGPIVDGNVLVGEYNSDKSLTDIQKLNKGDRLKKSQKEGLYEWQYMSYGKFLDYLQKNNMRATTQNLLVDADSSYIGHDPHLETNWLKSYMKKPSLADLFHGVKGVIHGIEHFLEKGSKLNASRSALWMARKMGLPPDIIAQLTADEVGNMKDIIQKMVDKLKSLNGPHARDKALHIVHDKGSRPEEVVAAALFMVQSYGHLYAEDIRHAQGSESFINAIIYACGYTTTDQIREQKQKARIKFKGDIGKEPGGQITEEEMIWGFLKGIDGNYDANPLAGALVKAMGGPSGWERAWRDEGYKGAREKGVRQTSDLPNGQGRLNKFISALATHEFNTALGMMGTIPGKNPGPELQGAPVIWALTGMSQYIGTKTAQDIWQFCASKGHSFHAYAFLRHKNANDQYKAVFFAALEGIATHEEIDQLKKDIATVQHTGHEHEKYKDEKSKAQLAAIQNINTLWVRYQGRGLHDRLQGKNDWLIKQANEKKDQDVEQYLKQMADVHEQNSGEKAHSDDNGWYIQRGTVGSPIMSPKKIKTEIDGQENEYQVNSLDFMLAKLQFKSGAGITFASHDAQERIWDPCVSLVKNLPREDSAIIKAQYKQYRYDILKHFNDSAAGIENGLNLMKQRTYYKDFLAMGIDPAVLFTGGDNLEKRLNSGWEDDFLKWRTGGRYTHTDSGVNSAKQKTHDAVFRRMPDAANTHTFREAA